MNNAKEIKGLKSLREKVKSLEKAALELKRAEDALGQSKERFRPFVESTTGWIWAIDREGRHICSNPAVEKILGYRAKELEGKDRLVSPGSGSNGMAGIANCI